MGKHSKSRSRSTDRKRDHKHKDKKKHRKHSRSGDRSETRREDRPRDRDRKYQDDHGSGSSRSHREDRVQNDKSSSSSRGGGFSDQPKPQQHIEQQQPPLTREEEYKRYQIQQEEERKREARRSRFSDQRKYFNIKINALANQPSTNQQNGFNPLDSKQLMPPPPVPQKKKKFVWTDADEEDLKQQQLKDKRMSLDESHPALMFGANPSLMQNLSPAILNALQDSSKIKKKIYLPKNTGVNYIGLLIGPRGLYQKRLEEESGCKILIRGKGSQKEGSAPQPDDNDEQHVLVIGDSAESVRRAQNAIERVISADDSTRNKIREEQLNVAQQINNQVLPNNQMDDSMMTPYGPPSPYAYIIPVPNDCVGLIIGKGGDTIRQLQMESGAKIQVAKKEIPNSNLRNVFVEGIPEKYQRAKEMIEEIIREHRRTADPQIHVGDVNPFSGPHQKIKVPDKFVGLIIGKNGENLRGIAQRSNTKIFVPQKNTDPGSDERTIEADGDPQSCEIARQEILSLIQRYMSQSSSSNFDYSKNPYGSGIAVYNQQKLASDGQAINGAVPDSLKPESGSFASSLLTENPMIAYASMQLTGWSYEDQNQVDGKYHQASSYSNVASKHGERGDQELAGQYGQEGGYDYSAYQNYYTAAGADPNYDAAYYQQYYGQQQQQQQYYDQSYGQQKAEDVSVGNNPEQQLPQEGQVPPQQISAADQQYNQDYYNQYYQQYYQGGAQGDYAAYYQQQQQYYAAGGMPPGYEQQPQPDTGAYAGTAQEQLAIGGDQQQTNQQPGQ